MKKAVLVLGVALVISSNMTPIVGQAATVSNEKSVEEMINENLSSTESNVFSSSEKTSDSSIISEKESLDSSTKQSEEQVSTIEKQEPNNDSSMDFSDPTGIDVSTKSTTIDSGMYGAGFTPIQKDSQITIPDPIIREVINKALNHVDDWQTYAPTISEIGSIKGTLSLSINGVKDQEITSLEGVQYLTGISQLTSNNVFYPMDEMDKIGSLTQLTYISLSDSNIDDISFAQPLIDSGNLTGLVFPGNRVKDVSSSLKFYNQANRKQYNFTRQIFSTDVTVAAGKNIEIDADSFIGMDGNLISSITLNNNSVTGVTYDPVNRKFNVPELIGGTNNYIEYTFKDPSNPTAGAFYGTNTINIHVLPEVAADVTAKYQDETGNTIAPDEVLSGNVGDSFTTTQKDIQDYTFKEVQGTTSGKFTDQAQTATYIYERSDAAPVTVKYEDKDGNKLADPDELSGKVGLPYQSQAKSISGYVLKTTPTNATGVFTDKPQTVTYVYVVDQTSIDAIDSTIYVGDTWNEKDNFVSATDKDGKVVGFKDVKVSGTVDKTKAGKYDITYEYGGKQTTITVTVLADQTSVKGKDSTIYVGDSWKAEDNFVSAADKDGKQVDFKDVKVTGAVDTTKAGTYDITYEYGGKQTTITVTVLPNQTSLEVKDFTIYVGEFWLPDYNFVSATDKTGNNIGISQIRVTGSVDYMTPGTYKVTYDNNGVIKTASVNVLDLAQITVHDSKLYVGDNWTEKDNFDKAQDVRGNPVALKDLNIDGTVNTSKAGTYDVTYSIIPASIPPFFIQNTGNYSATATITVLADQTSVKAKDSTIYVGDSWKAEDNFISATDKDGKTIDFKDVKVSGTVDTTKAGTYDITYEYGGQKTTITVTVLADKTSIRGKDSTIYVGDSWEEEDNFVFATDKDGKTVDFKDVKVNGTVDTTKSGKYDISYEYGGKQTTITVTVLADQTSVKGKDSTIYVGDSWKAEDNFISATDKDGKSIDFKDVKVSGTVDITKAGKYDITYEYGGQKTTITVTVLADKTSIRGKDSTIYVDDSWKAEDNFISATDKDGKSIDFNDVKVSGTVDTTKPGAYNITYEYGGQKTMITVTVMALAKNVTIHYQDEDGQTIAPDKVLSGKLGTAYTSHQVKITGYTFKSTQGNISGVFTAKEQSVTYVYTKSPVKGADVVVHYQDENGNQIAPDKVLSGNIGDTYSTEALSIDGYSFEKAQGNISGKLTGTRQIVTYYYVKKQDKVDSKPKSETDKSVKHVVKKTQSKLPQTGVQVQIGELILGFSLLMIAVIMFIFKRLKTDSKR